MRRELQTEPELDALPSNGKGHHEGDRRPAREPLVMDVATLLALQAPAPSMLIENMIPERGASLIVGAAKSNKTLLAVQMGISVASGTPFLDNYRVLQSGPVFILEQDDPAGAGSITDILMRSPVPVAGLPRFQTLMNQPYIKVGEREGLAVHPVLVGQIPVRLHHTTVRMAVCAFQDVRDFVGQHVGQQAWHY